MYLRNQQQFYVITTLLVIIASSFFSLAVTKTAKPPEENTGNGEGIPLPLVHSESQNYVGQRLLVNVKHNNKVNNNNQIQDKTLEIDNNELFWDNHHKQQQQQHLNFQQQPDLPDQSISEVEANSENDSFRLNSHCTVYPILAKIMCKQLVHKNDLPIYYYDTSFFDSIRHGVFLNTSASTDIHIEDLKNVFPNLVSLSITHSSLSEFDKQNNLLNELSFTLENQGPYKETNPWYNNYNNRYPNRIHQQSSDNSVAANTLNTSSRLATSNLNNNNNKHLIWPSVKILDLSNNNNCDPNNEIDEDSEMKHSQKFYSVSISKILEIFPNLEQLELKKNRIATLYNITRQNQLKSIDISDNPLDCTTEEIQWLESSNITLLNLDSTLCDRPPHQNKPKPILQTIHLIKKVQDECRVNCSCKIDYIWEQEKVIHSKTSVNCSNRNFIDFPDPDLLPLPTDTLYLNYNQITSLKKFVEDIRYTNLNVTNLYLEGNQILSLNDLEQSDWIYNFQILNLRKNNLTDLRVHIFENIIRMNRRIYQIDLSGNNWKCDCRTLSTFKIWLLQHYKFVKNIHDVKCERTGQEIRYLRSQDWCELEQSKPVIEFLDILNIFMALLILIIVGKVMYDYWNFSRHGKVPWLVGKIW